MAKIKIKDLPKDMKISKDELKRIKGGVLNTSDLLKFSKKVAIFADHEGEIDAHEDEIDVQW